MLCHTIFNDLIKRRKVLQPVQVKRVKGKGVEKGDVKGATRV